MALVFYPKSHRYKLDGRWVPGVSTIVKKGYPNDALKFWSARRVAEWVADNPTAMPGLRALGRGPMIAALKDIPWHEGRQAAIRGTDVHAYAERVIQGDEVDVPEDVYDYVRRYADWLDEEQVKPLHVEQIVGNRAIGYAGKFDLLCEYRGQVMLGDVKTGGVYESHALQLVGYEHAEFMLIDGAEISMPRVDLVAVIAIDPETGVDVIPILDRDMLWSKFPGIAATAKARKEIEACIGAPLPTLAELADLS